MDCHFVRDKLHDGPIQLHHIATTQQLANILTNKVLTGVKHHSILGKLSVHHSPPT